MTTHTISHYYDQWACTTLLHGIGAAKYESGIFN